MKRRLRAFTAPTALALSLALIASGCSSDKDSSSKSNSNSDTTAKSMKPVSGGKLAYALEAESPGYCLPTAQLAASGIQVANSIYDSLFVFDSKFEPVPYLAESATQSDDKLSWTLKLRSGVKFHDGTDLTSSVVKLNYDVARGEAGAVASTGLIPQLFPFTYQNIADITAPDPLTVVFTTKVPWTALPAYLASGRQGVAAEAQLRSGPENCAKNMIGTGPFQLVSWENGKVMKLKKNPNYWRKDADGVQLPYLDELEYYPIDGNTNRYDALEGNTVQAAMFNNQVQVDALSTNDKYAMVNEAAGHREVAYGLTNVSKAPLDDIEVRKHVGMAIDRDRLNEINSEGAWDIANGPFDTDVMGYLEDPGMVKYDKAAATEFFKGKSIAFRLSFATDATTEQIANEVKRQLAEVGVEVTVDQKDQPTLIDQAIAGDFNVLLWRNHPGADPDTQYVWWHSGMPTNFGRINDPRVDKALDEGRVESDPAKRKAIYEDLNKALVEGAYNLWNWRTEWTTGHYATVHGLGDATLPDGSKTAGQWAGWHAMTEAWVEK